MKQKLFALALGLLFVGLNVPTAQALPITGSIDMSGTAFLDNPLLGSATAVTSFAGVTVGGIPTGSFTGVPMGTSVAWNPFAWAPPSTPVTPLWSFIFGGATYAFNLTAVTVDTQDNQFLNLLGQGTLTKTGFDPTPGIWSFTISNPGGGPHANFAFTFADSQTAVPEGGSALALLGVGLISIGALRKVLARVVA